MRIIEIIKESSEISSDLQAIAQSAQANPEVENLANKVLGALLNKVKQILFTAVLKVVI